MYLTPLKGLYFSPYISRRLTLRLETAICDIVNCTLMVGLEPKLGVPGGIETLKG